MSDQDVIESEPRPGGDAGAEGGTAASSVSFPELRPNAVRGPEAALDRVYDLTVPVTVELGRATLSVQDILQLAPGSIVELERSSEAPVELFVHGKCVAKGQIVVVDGYYGIRITSLDS